MRHASVAAVLVLTTVCAFGQGKGKGHGKPAHNSAQPTGQVSVSVVFGTADRGSIQEWMRGSKAGSLPPGLAKRGELPPGLQKQLRRGGTLPPGLEKKLSPFPAELDRRLGPLPADCACQRVFLDGKAMIIARAAGAILDVIDLFQNH